MKIIVEANIPYIKGVLEPHATVEYLKDKDITCDAMKDVDALLVRTRTMCNESLLSNSACRFIATATIGTDHIDKDYCAKKGISVYSAPGCNAPAVAQYVISSIGHWIDSKGILVEEIPNITLGIVGVGNVGSIIERWAREIGFKVLLNDPPRGENEGGFVTLDTLSREADIITFHTPLTREGPNKTYHLCDENFLRSLSRCRLIINSARGEIVDTPALVAALNDGKIDDAIIDCWENEPALNSELLNLTFIATPHIAGYSSQGKERATTMILNSLKEYFGIEIDINNVDAPLGGAKHVTITSVMDSYNPLIDSVELKKSPQLFEEQRNNYKLRGEVIGI